MAVSLRFASTHDSPPRTNRSESSVPLAEFLAFSLTPIPKCPRGSVLHKQWGYRATVTWMDIQESLFTTAKSTVHREKITVGGGESPPSGSDYPNFSTALVGETE